MRQLSEATSRITGRNFSRKYVALGRIVNAWSDIVGKDLAGKAQPIKINYRKAKERGTQPQPSPALPASTADATLLHYQKDLILERINQIFGDRWITAIRFVNVPANTAPKKRKKVKKPLTDKEQNHLHDMLDNVPDSDIKSRLERLGKAVLMEEKSP